MKTDEQRIAIAQACPQLFWIYRSPTESSRTLRPPTPRLYRIGEHPNNGDEQCDPLNDLNAMNEAEKVLTDDEYVEYEELLLKYCDPENKSDGTFRSTGWIRWASATAAQRAEAFLKTLGLWTD